MTNEKTTKEYWNERAKKGGSPQDLVLTSTYLEEFELETRKILSLFKGCFAFDIGCGYGRLADAFAPEKYAGFDFSEEMIKIAKEKNPKHHFFIEDMNTTLKQNSDKRIDIIFEAMCLSSFEMTPEQFRDKFKDYARIIICFEPHDFRIFYI